MPTVDPRYWTEPPESVVRLKSDPGLIRVFGKADKSAAEPGYVSEADRFPRGARSTGLEPARGLEHLRIPRRDSDHSAAASRLHGPRSTGGGRFDIESVTHVLTGRRWRGMILPGPSQPAGKAFIHRNERALPRVRLAGKPLYAKDVTEAIALINRLTQVDQLRDRLIVEDPARPLPADAEVTGTARIAKEVPERVVVETDSRSPSYLVVSDSFDPGWSATIDGQAATIYPAYCAFRAVYLPKGKHTVVFEYSPAGFKLGLWISVCGVPVVLLLWFFPRRSARLEDEHRALDWPARWQAWYFAALVAIVLLSVPGITKAGELTNQSRWDKSFHQFTWGAGLEAMRLQPRRPGPIGGGIDGR